MKHGDKVICHDDKFTPEQIAMIPNRPKEGSTYHVDLVLITRNGKGVTLIEIDNPLLTHPSNLGSFEPSFHVNRFKKVEDVPEVVELMEEVNQ